MTSISRSTSSVQKNSREATKTAKQQLKQQKSIKDQSDKREELSNHQLCDSLREYNGVTYDISALVCSKLSHEKLLEPDLLSLMKQCRPNSKCDPCTSLGSKIAKSLIKVAALRIFAEPAQSIIELVSNSVDSYYPDKKIGKFGMGFFSILYWLVGHPKRHLVVYSKTESCAYSVIIKEIDGNLTFTTMVDDSIGFSGGKTGTRVLLEAAKDPFTKQELKQIYKQLHKLEYLEVYYPNLNIETDQLFLEGSTVVSKKKREQDSYSVKKNLVSIISTLDFFSVQDNGSGIPIQILLNSLLVPAVSTKGLKLQNNKDLEFGTSKGKDLTTIQYNVTNESQLNFLVSGLVIAKVELPKNKLFACKLFELPPVTYTIDFPRNTRLPVSRDDIILTPEIEKIFRNGITKLFNLSIQGSGTSDIVAVNQLQMLLEQYAVQTSGEENKRVVRQELDKFYNENKGRLVPANEWKIYNNIATTQNIPIRFIGSNRYDSWEIEATLDKYAKSMENIWLGFKVILIPSIDLPTNITAADLNKYLFVNKEYVDRNPQTWINNLALSYTSNQLTPYSKLRSTTTMEEVRENLERKYDTEPYFDNEKLIYFDKILRPEIRQKLKADSQKDKYDYKVSELILEPDIIDIFFIVLSKYTSTNKSLFKGYPNVITEEGEIRNLRNDLLLFYAILTANQYRDVLSALINKMSSFKGNQTYGGATYYLQWSYESDECLFSLLRLAKLYGVSDPNSLSQKSILYNHILASIKSVQESEITILSLRNSYDPAQMALDISPRYPVDFIRIVNKLPLNLKEYTYLLGGAGQAFATYTKKLPPDHEIRNYINYVLNDIKTNHPTDRVSDLYNIWKPNFWMDATTTFVFIENYKYMTKAWLSSFKEIIIPVKTLTDIIYQQDELPNKIRTKPGISSPVPSGDASSLHDLYQVLLHNDIEKIKEVENKRQTSYKGSKKDSNKGISK